MLNNRIFCAIESIINLSINIDVKISIEFVENAKRMLFATKKSLFTINELLFEIDELLFEIKKFLLKVSKILFENKKMFETKEIENLREIDVNNVEINKIIY